MAEAFHEGSDGAASKDSEYRRWLGAPYLRYSPSFIDHYEFGLGVDGGIATVCYESLKNWGKSKNPEFLREVLETLHPQVVNDKSSLSPTLARALIEYAILNLTTQQVKHSKVKHQKHHSKEELFDLISKFRCHFGFSLEKICLRAATLYNEGRSDETLFTSGAIERAYSKSRRITGIEKEWLRWYKIREERHPGFWDYERKQLMDLWESTPPAHGHLKTGRH